VTSQQKELKWLTGGQTERREMVDIPPPPSPSFGAKGRLNAFIELVMVVVVGRSLT